MSDNQKENRINVEDLPQVAREVSPEEANEVRGGGIVLEEVMVSSWQTGASDGGGIPSQPAKGGDDILIAGTTSYGHVK
jgi:hypothetical protein